MHVEQSAILPSIDSVQPDSDSPTTCCCILVTIEIQCVSIHHNSPSHSTENAHLVCVYIQLDLVSFLGQRKFLFQLKKTFLWAKTENKNC